MATDTTSIIKDPVTGNSYSRDTSVAGSTYAPYTPPQNGAPPSTVATTQSITPTSQGNTSPTIPTSTLTDTKKFNLPSATTPSASTAASAVIGAAGGLNSYQSALLGTTDANVGQAQQKYDAEANHLQSLVAQYSGKGADQLAQENAAGIPGLRSTAATLATQYATQNGAYNQQYQDILNNPNASMEQKANQISTLQQKHGLELTGTAIQQSLAETNYTNAQNLINHQIDIKYGSLKDTIDFGMQFLNQNKDLLSQKQAQSFEANLAVQQQLYTQSTYYAHLNSDTGADFVKQAAANGADEQTIQSMSELVAKGASYAEVAAAGGSYLQNQNTSVVQTGIDQSTGLPIYSKLNPRTGQLTPLNYNGALGQTGDQGTIVNGYQMGATTTIGAYASATQQQVHNINATVAKIGSAVGNITDAKTAQVALNTVAKGSPITGAMVMAAATQYDVDPSVLIGVMQAETQCGTDGSKGSKQCNWGNVGNTDSLMASGKSVAMTPQQGVNAVAKNLAMRKVDTNSGQVDPAQPVTPTQTLTPIQQAQVTIKNAPALLQPAMASTATGSVYIDSSKIPSNLAYMGQAYATKSGVPVLNSEQVAIVKGADEAARNITEVIAPAWKDIAPTGVFDRYGKRVSSGFGALGDTDFFSKNNTFRANQESLAQQIRALAQSAPKSGLLETASNALPINAGYFKDSKDRTYDTLKDGNNKMQRTLDLLNQTIKTYLPDSQGYTLQTHSAQPQQMVLNGQTLHLQADGTYK